MSAVKDFLALGVDIKKTPSLADMFASLGCKDAKKLEKIASLYFMSPPCELGLKCGGDSCSAYPYCGGTSK